MKNPGKRRIFIYLVNIFAALLTGLIVYLIFRPDTYLSVCFYRIFRCEVPGERMRQILPESIVLFIRNYLCDILWAYALTLTLHLLTGAGQCCAKTSALCLGFETAAEYAQKAGIMNGTFDPYDILFEAAVTAAVTLFIYNRREMNNEKTIPDS